MKILVLSRPIVNAGDFLFTNKSIEAFRKICPEAEVVSGHLLEELDIDYLNQFESIVCAGGPLYDDNFLENEMFLNLYKNINRISARIYILSGGWYGRDASDENVYEFKFSNVSLEVLKAISESGGALSCRDEITKKVLLNNAIQPVKMVGCTAWYDYEKIDDTKPKYDGTIKKIVISDQGITKEPETWEWKYRALCSVVETIKMMYPESNLVFTFNGGIDTKYSALYNKKVCNYLEKQSIKYYDISGSDEGFKICCDCDLHVGFRVHSHIFCMSKRIPSILIGEDARGISLNQTLGAPDIKDFSYNGEFFTNNKYLDLQLKYYLEGLQETSFELLREAYRKMQYVYWNEFVPFIKEICNR